MWRSEGVRLDSQRAVYFPGRGANGPLPTAVGTYVDKNNKVWVGGKKTETETSTETVRRRGRREMEVRGKSTR